MTKKQKLLLGAALMTTAIASRAQSASAEILPCNGWYFYEVDNCDFDVSSFCQEMLGGCFNFGGALCYGSGDHYEVACHAEGPIY